MTGDLFSDAGLALPKEPRLRDRAHCGFIASLPCIKCFVQFQIATREVHVAHVRFGDPACRERDKSEDEHAFARGGKPPTGMQEKLPEREGAHIIDDKWTVPLCPTHHLADQHAENERLFWAKLGVDVVALCQALYACSGDRDAAQRAFTKQANRARQLPPDTPFKLRDPESPEAKRVIEKFLNKEKANA